MAVQGSNCAPEVARAIEGFNNLSPGGALPRPDLIIVARGGGSIEDLWGFNEEIVARAVAASQIPLISAVGHETDTTLIDYVSDLRAPTPTAAAEHAVPVRLELLGWVENQSARMANATSRAVQLRRQRLGDVARALPRPDTLLETPRQRLDRVSDRLPNALIAGVQRRKLTLSERAATLRPATLRSLVEARKDRLKNLSSRLTLRPIQQDTARKRDALDRISKRLNAAQTSRIERHADRLSATARQLEILSYKATLSRGYAVVRDGDALVTNTLGARNAAALSIEFADGTVEIGANAATPKKTAPKPAAPKPPKTPGEQGSLF